VVRPVTMLAGVGVVLVIMLAPYLRPWLAQRSDIAAKQAEVESLQRQVDELKAQRERWNDPVFVKAQARERLNFVMPGELGYVVLDDGDKQRKMADPAQQAAVDAGRISGRPWYDVFWQSMQLAGRPAATPGGSRREAASGGAAPNVSPTSPAGHDSPGKTSSSARSSSGRSRSTPAPLPSATP
jgi:hypothetical protein